MVSGMERSGASAHGWRRTPRTADTYGDGRNDIVARIAGDIAAGLTVRQIAGICRSISWTWLSNERTNGGCWP